MLWVFIDNSGTVLCDVNVGNRIRQGNDFDVFVCFQGQPTSTSGDDGSWTEDTAIWGLRNITYIKPTSNGLEGVYTSDPQLAAIQFKLGTPSQANTQFIGGNYYQGWLVHIAKEATTFRGNGGHMTLMFSMKDLAHAGDMSYDQYAQTISVFLEPTYGQQPSMITLTDYDTLMGFIRDSTVLNLGDITDESDLDVYYYTRSTEDNPRPDQPNAFYTYVYEGVPYFLFVAHDDDWVTYQQKIGFDATSEGQYMTASQRNNAGGEWSEWVAISELPITNIVETPITDEDGLVTHHISIYVYGVESPYSFDIKDGVGLREMQVNTTTSPYGLVTNFLKFIYTDGTEKNVTVTDGVGISNITSEEDVEDNGINVVSVTLTDGTTKNFNVRNGSKGEPCLGNIGVTMVVLTELNRSSLGLSDAYYDHLVGHLLMFYGDVEQEPSDYVIVDESNLESLEPYGITSAQLGHLVHLARATQEE